jgi:hypothetical protein
MFSRLFFLFTAHWPHNLINQKSSEQDFKQISQCFGLKIRFIFSQIQNIQNESKSLSSLHLPYLDLLWEARLFHDPDWAWKDEQGNLRFSWLCDALNSFPSVIKTLV